MATIDNLKKDTFTCLICGKPSSTRFYCSPECKAIYAAEKSGNKKPLYCPICNKLLGSTKLIYCSEKCYKRGSK